MKATRVTQLDDSTDKITNMDVEMQVPLNNQWSILVLDTNILLEFLDTIQKFVSEAEQRKLPVLIMIPGAVIHELDAQKNRDSLAWFARRASTWLLKKVKERSMVRSQALDETCKSSGNWKTREPGEELGRERANDGLILDCCQYFSRVQQCHTLLCSKDKLLAVEAESIGIPTLSPTRGVFCSHDIILAIFGRRASILDVKEVDGMDVDDDWAVTEPVRPNHPLDLLHLQVVGHFAELLLELVTKVAGPEAEKFGTVGTTSEHAPAYTRKQILLWTPSDSLEFLNTKKPCLQGSPRANVFLRRQPEGGARRGWEWSRRDWEVGLRALGRVGDMWGDEGRGIKESVSLVELEMERVFALDLRPTGLGVGVLG